MELYNRLKGSSHSSYHFNHARHPAEAYQLVEEGRVVSGREVAVVVDERRVLRESLLDGGRPLHQHGPDRSRDCDAPLPDVLDKEKVN